MSPDGAAGRRWRAIAASLGAAAGLALSGCYPANPKLAHFDPNGGYRFRSASEIGAPSADSTLVLVSLSGGGTRAAAFGYGVLEELRDTPIGGGRSLLDEVDVMSSVSGGSFVAAYYALFGRDAFFAEFPDAVLYRDIETALALRILAPWNWPWLLSPYYGRSDLAADYYDAAIFRERQFKDLPRRPFIVLNATDIGRGAQFPFTQEYFDPICSDLDRVHVARGVTASSAFPVAFTPLTIDNYGAGACGYREPPWVAEAKADLEVNPQLYALAATWRSYENAARRPYLHLSDGGLADNIGLRAFETAVWATRSIDVSAMANLDELRRLVVIVVDAKPRSDAPEDRSARPPGIFTVLEASATTPMENYSSDTVERFRLWFDEWRTAGRDYEERRRGCDELAGQLCRGSRAGEECERDRRARCYAALAATDELRPPDPRLFLIHVQFESIPDPVARKSLESVETRLQLPRAQVDALVQWARWLLRSSPQYRSLLDDLRRDPAS